MLNTLTRVAGVTTEPTIHSDVQFEQVIINLKLNLPMIEKLAGFNVRKEGKIALVGGGPSLKNNLEELKEFKVIISCGSVHDYLINNNIIPNYAVNCDPDPICADYFTKSRASIIYLIASNSSKEVLKTLKDKNIYLWHCHNEDILEKMVKLEESKYNRTYHAIGGGCTVGLRSISIALSLGYTDIHLFGFDSSMGEYGLQHHAYEWANPEKESIDQVYNIQIGPRNVGPDTKRYYVAGYQLAQMENFKEFYLKHKNYFKPTFHGTGALPDYFELIKKLEQQAGE